MAIPSDFMTFIEDSHGTLPEGAGGLGVDPSAMADRRRTPEPLHQMVNMALAVSVVLGGRVGFAPFRNGNWRADETRPPSR
jgi:hypothetical protein